MRERRPLLKGKYSKLFHRRNECAPIILISAGENREGAAGAGGDSSIDARTRAFLK
jgi:hypothetical protein